jgi:hypothetical protein
MLLIDGRERAVEDIENLEYVQMAAMPTSSSWSRPLTTSRYCQLALLSMGVAFESIKPHS